MKKSNLIYLDHIFVSLKKSCDYIEGYSFEMFIEDEEKQDAIIRKLEVAGEATKNLSAELKNKNSHIPWREIAGMRDKLIHGYFDVDIDVVWNTVTNEIPSLLSKIEEIIQALEKDG